MQISTTARARSASGDAEAISQILAHHELDPPASEWSSATMEGSR